MNIMFFFPVFWSVSVRFGFQPNFHVLRKFTQGPNRTEPKFRNNQTEPTILAWFGRLFRFGPKFAQPYKTVSYQGCFVEDYG